LSEATQENHKKTLVPDIGFHSRDLRTVPAE